MPGKSMLSIRNYSRSYIAPLLDMDGNILNESVCIERLYSKLVDSKSRAFR